MATNEWMDLEFKKATNLYFTHDDAGAAFPLMMRCAEAGNPNACFLLALMYCQGEGVAANEKEYRFWLARLLKIAEECDPVAQWEVSCKYRWGNHFPTDIRRANHWLERSAEGGNGDAQHLLAWYLETGQYDYPIDRAESESWYQLAFAQGHPEALYTFALREFKDGKITEKAIALLRKAADQGFQQASHVLREYTH